jgi:hypothetical protein
VFRAAEKNYMKKTIVCFLLASGLLSAATIDVYSTGYTTGGGFELVPTLADGNWTLVSGPGGSVPSPYAPYVTFGSLLSQFPFSSGGWLKNNSFGSSSERVGPDAIEQSNNPYSSTVPYVYQETFTLAGMNLSSVVIDGEWSADNYGYIVVNGAEVTTGIDGIIPNSAGEFKSFTDFALNSSNADFLQTTNVIQFDVFNTATGSPDVTGINVDFESATADPAPEPATFGIMGCALVALGVLRRTARR